ncbi:iron-containing alcohol dehydrogenase [Shewanella mesophila]|uniref:iron-containing alcohol dehydrogenase n=1 Tax=Shewanella mesophila TaxID=2864208 RepID=UPI001C65D660|nr:iron-containing alcohol dehydrogenase [Shewanella mesophila]QYJ85921.1 iron-containing alcohol dehydrogenase [Shewanella mesophila]
MHPFTHLGNAKLIFGNGEINKLADLVKPYKSVQFITGKHFVETESWAEIQTKLRQANVHFNHNIVSGEPTPQIVDSLTEIARLQEVEVVVAIGGGSVLDAGKAVAAMLCHQGSVLDYLEGIGTKTPEANTLPLIAVPTTAGTGSEATKNAVIGQRGEKPFKKSLRHDAFVPRLAILDPQLAVGTPKLVTLACSMDSFCQLLESLVSTKATPLTHALALQGISLFSQGSQLFTDTLYGTPTELELRGKLALAAYLSGLSLANGGLGTVHGIAGPLGAVCNIPHGAACGILLGPVFRRLLEKSSIKQFTLARQTLFGETIDDLEAIDLFEQWAKPLGKLSDYGLRKSDIDAVVAHADNKNSPVSLDENEMKQLLLELL